MIDLSTLIALLTALASATAASPPGSPAPRADQPPGQHCSATPGTPGAAGSVAPYGTPAGAHAATPAAPPPSPDRPTGSLGDDESESPTNRQLHAGAEENDEEADAPTTTRAPTPSADNDAEESDRSTGRQNTERRTRSENSATKTEPRPTRESQHESTHDGPENEPDPDPDVKADTEAETEAETETETDTDSETGNQQSRSTTRNAPQRDPRTGDHTGTRPPTGTPGTDRRTAPTGQPDRRYPDETRCAEPVPDPEPDRPVDRPGRDREAPSDLVDLDSWYLTLPTGADGDPDTLQPKELTGYSSVYFRLNTERDGVVFTAPVDGVTTRNSDYPRSELREMRGTEKAAWSNGSGTHTLRATEAVTELPEAKPELVTAQIHGGDDDILQIRLEGNHLMVQYDDGGKQITLDPDYRLGTPYDIEIVAATNAVRVSYNGEQKAELPLSGSTWYFKAGAYVQSNPSQGDAATAAGQVIIYSLEVDHT